MEFPMAGENGKLWLTGTAQTPRHPRCLHCQDLHLSRKSLPEAWSNAASTRIYPVSRDLAEGEDVARVFGEGLGFRVSTHTLALGRHGFRQLVP